MKKIFLVLLLIISAEAHSQWTIVSQTPARSLINSISVVDQNLIWISCDTGRVYKSTNAGATWLLRNSGLPSINLYGVSALDTSNCWVGTINGSIWRTSNGGMTWVQQFSLTNSFSNAIKMFDMNYGVYYGDPVSSGQPIQLRYTTNGGTNWLLSPNAPVSSNDYGVLNAWDWLDTGKFWLGSANVISNATSAKVFKTSGFRSGTWSTVVLSGTGNADGMFYQTIAFTDANNGMAGANTTSLRKTTDGGLTWSPVPSPEGIVNFFSYSMNALKDGSNTIRLCLGTVAGTFRCFKTTNLGTTWIEETLPALGVANGMHHMQFLSSTLGYAGGRNGLLMRYGPPTGVTLVNSNIPANFKLEQNFPNPFNPETIITYDVENSGYISLKVFDATGKEVAKLVNEMQNPGKYSVRFNAGNFPSGIYFYRLNADNYSETKSMMILK